MLKIDIEATKDVAFDMLKQVLEHCSENPTAVFGGSDFDKFDKNGVELITLHVLFED